MGVPGSISGLKTQENRPDNFQPDCLQAPSAATWPLADTFWGCRVAFAGSRPEAIAKKHRRCLGVWAALGGRETFQKGRGRRLRVSRVPGAAQTPKIDDLRSVKKSYIKKTRRNGLDIRLRW